MPVTVVQVRSRTCDADGWPCEQRGRITHRACKRSTQEQREACITVLSKAACEALRLIVGHRGCRSRVRRKSTAALPRERALRATAYAPTRCRHGYAGGADRTGRRVTTIRCRNGTGLLISAQATGHRVMNTVARLREVRIPANTVDARRFALQ